MQLRYAGLSQRVYPAAFPAGFPVLSALALTPEPGMVRLMRAATFSKGSNKLLFSPGSLFGPRRD
jgi:hypothetical protein